MLRNPMVVRQHHLVAGRSISVQKLGFKNYNYQSILMNFNLFKNQKKQKSNYKSTSEVTWLTCHVLSSGIHCGAMHCVGESREWLAKEAENKHYIF